MQMDQPRREALEKHIGACVILCQCIEHSLAVLTRDQEALHLLKGRELFDALAVPHTAPLESHFKKLKSDSRFHDMLPELAAIIERRNKIVHRAILSCDVIAHVEGEVDYDFDADLMAFRAFLSVVTQRMDSLGLGTATDVDERLLMLVRAAHMMAIEENREIAAKKKAQQAAKANDAQRT
jgi:hypothetical protein